MDVYLDRWWMQVHALQSRIIVAGYAFLVLIISSTYLANLAAFLTVDQIDSTISTITDLWGQPVATLPPYAARLEQAYRINAQTQLGAHQQGCLLAAVWQCHVQAN
jgi:Ligand-gated ion channel